MSARSFHPTPRSAPQFAREDREPGWYVDYSFVCDPRILPVQASSEGSGVGDPLQGNVVENRVPGETSLGTSLDSVRDLLVAVGSWSSI